jgi:hypothetical protein
VDYNANLCFATVSTKASVNNGILISCVVIDCRVSLRLRPSRSESSSLISGPVNVSMSCGFLLRSCGYAVRLRSWQACMP